MCQFMVKYIFYCHFTEDSELRRTLQSLACGRARPIIKKPKVAFLKTTFFLLVLSAFGFFFRNFWFTFLIEDNFKMYIT